MRRPAGSGGPIVHRVVTDYMYTTGTLPANLSYGFGASTGASINYHEIRTLEIVIPPTVAKAPVAVANSATTPENTPITFNITSNDYDENGTSTLNTSATGVDLDPSSAGTVDPDFTVAGKGTFHYNGDGTVTFTPVTDFFGVVPAITYTIKDDGNGGMVLISTSNAANIDVTVTEIPAITLSATNATVCQGTTSTSIAYSATPTGSPNQYRIDYGVSALAAGFVNVALAALPASSIPIAVPAGAAAAIYTANLYVKNSGTGLESVAYAITVTVNAVPATPTISAGGATTFCAGGSVTLTSTASSGNQWYKDAVLITGATSTTLVVTTAGVYTVITTSGSCSSAASAGTTVTVNALPTTPTISAGGPTTFCSGGSVTLTSSAASGNQWYLDGTAITGATATTLVVTANGTYTVTTNNGTCTSAASAGTPVTVNTTPSTPTISAGGATTFCAGGSVTLTSSAASGNQWYKDAVLITGATSTTLAVTTAGVYTVTATSGSCTSAASAGTTVTVNALPTTPTISAGGPTTFCSGSSVTLTSSAASGNQWYKDAVLITGETATTLVVTTAGVYTVTTNNGTCTSAASAGTTVTVNSTAQPSTITGSATPCTGSGQAYIVTNVSGVTYAWTYSGTGATITNGTTSSISIDFCGRRYQRHIKCDRYNNCHFLCKHSPDISLNDWWSL